MDVLHDIMHTHLDCQVRGYDDDWVPSASQVLRLRLELPGCQACIKL